MMMVAQFLYSREDGDPLTISRDPDPGAHAHCRGVLTLFTGALLGAIIGCDAHGFAAALGGAGFVVLPTNAAAPEALRPEAKGSAGDGHTLRAGWQCYCDRGLTFIGNDAGKAGGLVFCRGLLCIF